ncbi:zinc finger protein 622-like protein [Gossypium australe]|uniref:Zinc finger protein 622-like protein n=1 Tax=Gossypium australe TaxID=47621 RepID=A0A5B6UI15_9ROSI|nr:zinc finger protein 622-like protein [Gossypium australe]
MPGLTCNACNREFLDDAERKLHYKSDWHRYNLKRKVAGVPGVTEALFLARQAALAEEKDKQNETPMLYSCGLCGKGYRSSKAYSQHLKSRAHIAQASQHPEEEKAAIIKPFIRCAVNKPPQPRDKNDDDSDDDWVEVDPDEDLASGDEMDIDNGEETGREELDPSCCFMCDLKHDTIESCMVHMHKFHGFFIPDVEYLKNPEGLLIYLGLKVKRDFICLYCNERCHPFTSLEAVRKHMAAKGHCKVHYGDGDEDEEVELEEFYDYSSSYVDDWGKQLVAVGDKDSTVELGGGSELIITRKSDERIMSKTLGCREYSRYYCQSPRPSPANNMAVTAALASRYRSMGLATVQSKEQIVRMKVMKAMNRSGVETMRTKVGMKNNVIRNLPKNVPY